MYKEGDIVETKCWGFKGLHKCLLAKIGGETDRSNLEDILRGDAFNELKEKFNIKDEEETIDDLGHLKRRKSDLPLIAKKSRTSDVPEQEKKKSKVTSVDKKTKLSTPKKLKSLAQVSAELELTELESSTKAKTACDNDILEIGSEESTKINIPQPEKSLRMTDLSHTGTEVKEPHEIEENNELDLLNHSEASAFKPPQNQKHGMVGVLYREAMGVVNNEEASSSTFEECQSQMPSCGLNSFQVGQIWNWLQSLENRVNWLSTQQQSYQQFYTPRTTEQQSREQTYTRSESKVGEHMPHRHVGQGNGVRTSLEQDFQNCETSTCTSPQEQLYGSYTKNQLLAKIEGVTDYSKAAKTLFRTLYKEEEYRGRSLCGGKPNKRYLARPPLEDQTKLHIIYDIIHEKYGQGQSHTKEKLREILKPTLNK
ncbi:uncharacterized protein LOC132713334 [Ruditapes philippinarum]|uniref:uncharacterized protein LOC132713334 n=1 Tax=Ruditapes philippinarum TaxID=129788 RepID=UPI00295B8BAC|nr:uncharacterized protein LOC132713334 [Ruditapes philippinarum]